MNAVEPHPSAILTGWKSGSLKRERDSYIQHLADVQRLTAVIFSYFRDGNCKPDFAIFNHLTQQQNHVKPQTFTDNITLQIQNSALPLALCTEPLIIIIIIMIHCHYCFSLSLSLSLIFISNGYHSHPPPPPHHHHHHHQL